MVESNPSLQSVTVLENIHWQLVDGATVVTLWGNGDFVASGTAYQRVNGDSPREVLRLRGLERPYWESELVLATPHVRRLRLGYEPQEPFSELVLVLDLASQRVRVTDIELDGKRMTLRVSR